MFTWQLKEALASLVSEYDVKLGVQNPDTYNRLKICHLSNEASELFRWNETPVPLKLVDFPLLWTEDRFSTST